MAMLLVPSLGDSFNGAFEYRFTLTPTDKHFSTNSLCNLKFRYNPDLKSLGLLPEDEKLRQSQADEDLDMFGRRPSPKDVDATAEHAKEHPMSPLSATFSNDSIPASPGHLSSTLSPGNLAKLNTIDPSMSQTSLNDASSARTIPSIDWNSGENAMEAWLNASAMRGNEPVLEPSDEAFKRETEQLQQEMEAVKDLKRIHFIATAPETQPLQDVMKDFQNQPLMVQVHAKKILDRYPVMPAFLAKRLANSNVRREQRLRERLAAHGFEQDDSDEDEPDLNVVVIRLQTTRIAPAVA